ncbi:MAG: 50S ribosomal protein L29 [Patescibacteria group bacterium]
MDFTEIKNTSKTELRRLLSELQAKERELRFSAHARQLKNVRALRQTKKTIARILTQLSPQP